METKNAIGTIINEYNFDGICAADCSDGHIIFNLGFCSSPFEHIEEHIPVAKIRIKTIVKRDRVLGRLDQWMIDAIDNRQFESRENNYFGWIMQHASLPDSKDRKLTFKKGNFNILKKLAENKEYVKFNLYCKRFVDGSSSYDENNIYLNETIKVYFRYTNSRYNRHEDEFAKGCLKLGLDFNKYSYLNSPEMNLEKTMRSICNDLGYNLLTII